jgi:membrane-associated phospholipid phosphatase
MSGNFCEYVVDWHNPQQMLISSFLRFNRLDCFCLVATASVVLVKGGAEAFCAIGVLLGLWFWVKGPVQQFPSGVRSIALAMVGFLALKLLSVMAERRDDVLHGRSPTDDEKG